MLYLLAPLDAHHPHRLECVECDESIAYSEADRECLAEHGHCLACHKAAQALEDATTDAEIATDPLFVVKLAERAAVEADPACDRGITSATYLNNPAWVAAHARGATICSTTGLASFPTTDALLAADPAFASVCDGRIDAGIADQEERAYFAELFATRSEVDDLFDEEVARHVGNGYSRVISEQMAASYVAAVYR